MSDELGAFGEFLVRQLRDRTLREADVLARGGYKAPSVQALQQALKSLSPAQRQVALELVRAAVDEALHGFCAQLSDDDCEVRIVVRGRDIGAESEVGLNGELGGV